MGAAKQRGTYEQRVEQSKARREREAKEKAALEAARLDALTPEERKAEEEAVRRKDELKSIARARHYGMAQQFPR
jgi:hypothetical protein